MFLVDEDVRNGALLRHLLESILDGTAVIWKKDVNQGSHKPPRSICGEISLTNLVEFNGIVLRAHFGEESLCRSAIRTV